MFLINIGLKNNTATNHSELIQAIENAGLEINEHIYSVGTYDNVYEPTFVGLLILPEGNKATITACIDALSDTLTQECIPVCFGDLTGFMCGRNPKGYEFNRKFMLTINERNKFQPYGFPEYVSEPKVYSSFNGLMETMDFWTAYFSKEELKPLV